jgi:DNA-binding MarR family transcriptional regulator
MNQDSISDQHFQTRLEEQTYQLHLILDRLIRPPLKHPFPEMELSARDINLFHALNHGHTSIMTDLAASIGAPLSTVTRMVDRLESKGLIERQRSSEDRRIVLVQETAKGKRLRDAFIEYRLRIAHSMLEPLSLGEREILLELLRKLLTGLYDEPAVR